MTEKAWQRTFIWGSAFFFVLLAGMTVDSLHKVNAGRTPPVTDQVARGKYVFQRHNCNDCHTILGFGAYYAPDLTRVVQRVGEDGIRFRVKNPERAFANSWRKMPQQNLTDAEITDLIAFFTWVGEVNNNDWPPQDSRKRITRGEQMMVASVGVSPGAAVFQTKGCMNCHSLHGTGGTFGPNLDQVGRRKTIEEIEHYVRNPKEANPKAMMPPQKELSDRELEEVAKFLSSMK